MTIKLKPCPFCGGEVKLYGNGTLHTHYIACIFCTCDLSDESLTPEELVEKWNTRVCKCSK